MRVILASASPRRWELLRRVIDDFEIAPSDVEEPEDGPPIERVLRGACAKARDVAASRSGVVIGADTLVVLGETVLGKPESRDDARRMLEALSGREHVVLTGLCVVSTADGETLTAVEETSVRFRALSEGEIDAYLETGEADDKAGAYAIQGRAGAFVEGIEGDYHNVVGLPICRLVVMLREVGVAV